jgi:hypothetical protein
VAKVRKDNEMERKRKKTLKQLGDNDEDDDDDDDKDDDEEMGRWPGDGAVPPFHEEEKAIGSMSASDWDKLE